MSETPTGTAQKQAPTPSTDIRVFLRINSLERQFASYLATPTRARGYPPKVGDASLIVEVAPALAVQKITDVALKAAPDVEPGLLYVERQYGILEVHSSDESHVDAAADAILDAIGSSADDHLKPTVLYSEIIDDVGDQHAVILNRTREASMILPGSSLLVYELEPALFAADAANTAEKAAPDLTLVDVQMIGAAGRIFLAGSPDSVRTAQSAITQRITEMGAKP